MLKGLLPIVTNTFTEILRQPVYGVVVAATLILLIFSPSLAMFTLSNDNQLLKDIGLSTLMVAGIFLAVFASASVVTEEIENKTVLTVVTKSVSRPVFVIGKFLGITAAVLFAQYFLSLALMMIVRHGVMQTARDEIDWVVVVLGGGSALLAIVVGIISNYFYRWRFTSTAIVLEAILATIVMFLLYFIDPHWKFNPAGNNLHADIIKPLCLTAISTIVITAIAVAAALRVGLVMTLLICVGAFVFGACIQYWLGPIAAQSGWQSILAWIALAIVPSFNIYVVSNAIYEGTAIPLAYVAQAALYAFFYVIAALLFAIALFRNREIG